MITPDPNNPPAPPTVEQLSAQLAAIRSGIAKSIGLAEDATDEALLARAQEVAKQRDESRAEASALKSAVDAGKVDTALREAFAKSGATAHYEDFHNLAASHFHVDPKSGKVVTKPDASTPNVDPETWCVVELRQRRAAWWPVSQGGGLSSRGTGFSAGHANDAMYDPRSPQYNFTAQLAHEAKFGSVAADTARAKYRGRGGQ